MPQQTHKRLKLQPLQLLEAAVSSTSTQIKVIIEPFEQGSVTDVDHIIFFPGNSRILFLLLSVI